MTSTDTTPTVAFSTLVVLAAMAPAARAMPADERRIESYVVVLDADALPSDSGPLLVQYAAVSTETLERARRGEPFEMRIRFDFDADDRRHSQEAVVALSRVTVLGHSGDGTSTVAATILAEARPDASIPVAACARIVRS